MFRRQNNILTLITLFLSCIFFPAFAEVVNKIEISGNDRISSETIKMFSQVNIGDDLDDNEVNNLLKRLYDTNFFQDISIKLTSNKLSILVEENPIIENITYNGIKSSTLKEKILEGLSLNTRSSYDKILLINDKNKILSSLKDLGYYFSTVDVDKSDIGENKVKCTTDLKE